MISRGARGVVCGVLVSLGLAGCEQPDGANALRNEPRAGDGRDQPFPSTQDWLDRTVGGLRTGDSIEFEATFVFVGQELTVIDGEGTTTGYRVVVEPGADADGAPYVQYIEADSGRMRARTDVDGLPGAWKDIDAPGLPGLGVTGFHPEGTDLVTILTSLSLHQSTGDGAELAEADLRTALQALLGLDPVDESGARIIPLDSRVPVQLDELESGGHRLHIDGEALTQRLEDIGINPAGTPLTDPLIAVDAYIDYPAPD